jgi:hypothetical protein
VYETLYREKFAGPAASPSMVASKPYTMPWRFETLPPAHDERGAPLYFDGDLGYWPLASLPANLLSEGRYDELDTLFEEWSKPASYTADGREMLTAFLHLLQPGPGLEITQWAPTLEVIKRWQDHAPNSIAAELAEALYWEDYAWHARGRGYAASVTPEGWALLKEREEKAVAVLLKIKPKAASNPLWAELMLRAGVGLSWPKSQMLAFLRESTENKVPFWPLYKIVAESLLPKWGGNWSAFEAFARDAVSKTHDPGIYARIYWIASQGTEDPNIFKYSSAKWADVKDGFEALMRSYPHSAHNLNKFAVFACMADDKDTFQALRYRIGNYVVFNQWPGSYSLDLCEHKFPLQPL